MLDGSDSPNTEVPNARTLTAAEIGRAWGTSRQYASNCIKKGCPTTSIEAANDWRKSNQKYGVGYRSKGEPTDKVPQRESEESQAGNSPASDSQSGVARSNAPMKGVLKSLEDSLSAAIVVESEAYRLVREAQAHNKDELIAVRISAYNKARDGRFAAEKAFREEMERQKILVPLEEAKQIGRRGYDVLLPLLRSLPKNAGPRCNQENPLLATNVLSIEIEAIIAQGRKVYAA